MANSMDRKSLVNENRRLKQRLDIAQDELVSIKRSRAYSTIRLLGHVRDELRKSPVSYSKRVVKKVLGGKLSNGLLAAQKNLGLQGSLEEQYKEWITFNEPDSRELQLQAQKSAQFKKRPLISIITPVFDPPKDAFIELIECVLSQTYDNFELCLRSFGNDPEIQMIISQYAAKDRRVKDFGSGKNEGIAGNSNQLLGLAQGDYIALLDHDDTLSPDALYENAQLLNQADYDFIYSDKDKIDEQGARFDPFFKPAWSPEIMLNANYLTHFNVMKASVVKRVGGWDSTTDGAQDWDLFLKVVAASKLIGHIPKVLYHWRVIATSTAFSIETKPYALLGQRNAVDAYLKAVGVNSRTYHEGAELLLEWNMVKLKSVLIVTSKSLSGLRGFLSNATNLSQFERVYVLHNYKNQDVINEMNQLSIKSLFFKEDEYLQTLSKAIKSIKGGADVILTDDRINLDITDKDLNSLKGWLNIDGVKAVSPRIVDNNGFAIDCGAVITTDGIKPIFAGSPPYHQAAMGNIEWVRDLRVLTPLFTVMRTDDIALLLDKVEGVDQEYILTALHLILSQSHRLVFNPKIKIRVRSGIEVDVGEYYEQATSLLSVLNDSGSDTYYNPNLSAQDPMNLATIQQDDDKEELPETVSGYQTEAIVHAMSRSLSAKQLYLNFEHIRKTSTEYLKEIKSVVIILPDFQAIYAGLNNIFYFANQLVEQHGAHVTFALLSQDDECTRQKALIYEKYPQLESKSSVISISNETINRLPEADIAVCTQWATAYTLALYNRTKRKCYFIQDKEASFYPKGAVSALVENTYSFGFFALANTDGLLDWYEREFNGLGTVLRSQVDIRNYSPPESLNIKPKVPYKVFFYARPAEPRNAFELGLAGLIELKKRLGDDLNIYTAGADWNPHDYGLSGIVENLGKIAYDKLPSFYRSMDAGMMFMFSGHPGVVASELMASGSPVVVNKYNDMTWQELYKHDITVLESGPTKDEIADSLERILTDTELREKLVTNGLQKVKDFYGLYDTAFKTAMSEIQKGVHIK